MSKLISPNQRLTHALESIANAAEIFEMLDLNEAAEGTTSLLESVVSSIEKSAAKKKNKKKSPPPAKKSKPSTKKKNTKPSVFVIEEDPFTKNLDSLHQLKNIENFGWPFNEPEIMVKQDVDDYAMADDFNWINDIDADYSWVNDDENDSDSGFEEETYHSSAKNKIITRKRAIEEIINHHANPRDFFAEVGHKLHYKAQDVLDWLGY